MLYKANFLNDSQLENINGGGNFSSCALSISGTALATLTTGPVGLVGAFFGGASTSYNCLNLITSGD